MYRFQRTALDERPWLWVDWCLTITTVGHHVAFERGALDDEAWKRVRQIPRKLGECTIDSGTIRCSEWMARFAK
jgi:hypothetical protein